MLELSVSQSVGSVHAGERIFAPFLVLANDRATRPRNSDARPHFYLTGSHERLKIAIQSIPNRRHLVSRCTRAMLRSQVRASGC